MMHRIHAITPEPPRPYNIPLMIGHSYTILFTPEQYASIKVTQVNLDYFTGITPEGNTTHIYFRSIIGAIELPLK